MPLFVSVGVLDEHEKTKHATATGFAIGGRVHAVTVATFLSRGPCFAHALLRVGLKSKEINLRAT